jgi:hypothetical protein
MNTMPTFVRTFARMAAAVSLCTLLSGHLAFAQSQAGTAPAATATAMADADADDAPDAPEPRVAKGDATRAWLGAQASRKGASRTRQTLSGPVMSTVHERYVKSFSHEVERTPIRADMAPTGR